jgi:hypothetical protein
MKKRSMNFANQKIILCNCFSVLTYQLLFGNKYLLDLLAKNAQFRKQLCVFAIAIVSFLFFALHKLRK